MKLTYGRRVGQIAAIVGLLVPGLTASPIVLIPSSQWGTQYYQTSLTVWGALSSPCSNGWGNPSANVTCSESAAYYKFSGAETASAYNDANGIHLYAQSFASDTDDGYAAGSWATGWADAQGAFYDTLTNNSSAPAKFQIGVHVDGSLQADAFRYAQLPNSYGWTLVASDGAEMDIYFYGAPWGSPLQYLQDWVIPEQIDGSALNQTISRDFLTGAITLAPGASYDYRIVAELYTSSRSNGYNNSLTATADMANTLKLTGLSAFDESGRALPASTFGSLEGVNYSGTSSGTPEPGPFGLVAVPGVALLLYTRRRG